MSPLRAVASIALVAACRSSGTVSDVASPPPPPPSTRADAGTMQDLEARLRDDFTRRQDHLTAADAWPSAAADGRWQSPHGAPVTQVVRVGMSRPSELDGVPFTAYYAASEGLYWVHEGGGLSGTNRWYGPFPLR